MNEPRNATPTVQTNAVKKPGRAGLVLIILVLLGSYLALFFPAFSGEAPTGQLGLGATFWSGVGFYYLWKRLGREEWVGAILGAVIGIIVFAAAAFMSGVINASAGH